MEGHPVFIEQHATATCYRGFLKRWYRIEQGRVLSDSEMEFVLEWILDRTSSDYRNPV